jgi:arabinosaccharide transport system substrate-binding protein
MRPLIKDLDGDGTIDRYLLNAWYASKSWIDPLTIQAGGGTFDGNNELIINCEANAKVLAQMVSWCLDGPTRIAIDTRHGTQSGNELWLEGRVIATIMPDWMAGIFKTDMPGLGGKVKLMPLPASERGGRRTSVWGGTMVGIPKSSAHFEQAWRFAKELYLSKYLAKRLFQTNNIITPVREYWDADFYKEPDPYFTGQASGLLYLEQAPHVPLRNSSPFHNRGTARLSEATVQLHDYAARQGLYKQEDLLPKARELLAEAERVMQLEISRNVFIGGDGETTP